MAEYTRFDISEQEVAQLEVFDCIRAHIEVMRELGVPPEKIVNALGRANNLDHLDCLVEMLTSKLG